MVLPVQTQGCECCAKYERGAEEHNARANHDDVGYSVHVFIPFCWAGRGLALGVGEDLLNL
jgi:hypothetical protein